MMGPDFDAGARRMPNCQLAMDISWINHVGQAGHKVKLRKVLYGKTCVPPTFRPDECVVLKSERAFVHAHAVSYAVLNCGCDLLPPFSNCNPRTTRGSSSELGFD